MQRGGSAVGRRSRSFQKPLMLKKHVYQLPQHVVERLMGLLHDQRVAVGDDKAEVDLTICTQVSEGSPVTARQAERQETALMGLAQRLKHVRAMTVGRE